MKSLRQFFVGIASAFGSSLLVLAAILLSLTEGGTMALALPPTVPVNPTTILQTEDLSVTATATRLLVITATDVPQLSCPIPAGWQPYTLEAGDTLEALAAKTNSSIEQIQQANCLLSTSLLPGTILYLPFAIPSPTVLTATTQPTDTPQPDAAPCTPPRGWVTYRIQPKDNLTRLSLAYGISVNQLMTANCLNSSFIVSGTLLYVPNVPTRTPEQTDTPIPPTDTAIVQPSSTNTPEPETETPTPETPTGTPIATHTETPTETTTETIVPSETPTLEVSTPQAIEEPPTPSPTSTVEPE